MFMSTAWPSVSSWLLASVHSNQTQGKNTLSSMYIHFQSGLFDKTTAADFPVSHPLLALIFVTHSTENTNTNHR